MTTIRVPIRWDKEDGLGVHILDSNGGKHLLPVTECVVTQNGVKMTLEVQFGDPHFDVWAVSDKGKALEYVGDSGRTT